MSNLDNKFPKLVFYQGHLYLVADTCQPLQTNRVFYIYLTWRDVIPGVNTKVPCTRRSNPVTLLVAERAETCMCSNVTCTFLRYIAPYVHQQNTLSSSLPGFRMMSQWAVYTLRKTCLFRVRFCVAMDRCWRQSCWRYKRCKRRNDRTDMCCC